MTRAVSGTSLILFGRLEEADGELRDWEILVRYESFMPRL